MDIRKENLSVPFHVHNIYSDVIYSLLFLSNNKNNNEILKTIWEHKKRGK
jgi:hypothetical protein